MTEQPVAVTAAAHVEAQDHIAPFHEHIGRADDISGIFATTEAVQHEDGGAAFTGRHIIRRVHNT